MLLQRKPFDKELIRLLIDGHILIFSGVFYLLCYSGIRDQQSWAYGVSAVVALFVLGYCALIFKMLPSILTILINVVVLLGVIMAYYANRATIGS